MLPSLNYSKQDPKFNLLEQVFINIDGKKFEKILSRNGIKNIKMMVICIKIYFTAMFFDYPLSKVIDEIKRSKRLKKFLKIKGKTPTADQVYEYLSRYSVNQYKQITYSMINVFSNKYKKYKKNIIIDATSISVDIKHINRHISKEKLENLGLSWGYSKNKGSYIGFQLTIAYDLDSFCPVAILIHPGSPNDKIVFEDVLKELKRRGNLKNGARIYFDKGYCSYHNYFIGIVEYRIVPVIFPDVRFKRERLDCLLTYPLEVFSDKNKVEQRKKVYDDLKKDLYDKLDRWKRYKPLRGTIEDYYKVNKIAFGLDELHKYTPNSIMRNVYLGVLLATLTVQVKYDTKSKLQKLSEGNVELLPSRKSKKKNKKNKNKKDTKENVPSTTKQTELEISSKGGQTTLEKFIKI